MKPTVFSTLLSLLILSCCATVPENRAIDAFGWQRLEADCDPDSAQFMGLTDLDNFWTVVQEFPWREQAEAANRICKNSPTLSVDDLLTDHSFFISSGCASDGSDFGYFVGFIYPEIQKNESRRQVDTYSVDDPITLRKLTTLFFARDYETLRRRLSGHTVVLQSPERISREQYLKLKQAYTTK